MRTFKVDSPEYYLFRIEGDEKVYKIPLMASMNNREAKAFEDTDGDYMLQVEWLRTYIGDVIDEMTVDMTGDIIREWASASRDQGADLGES